MRISINKLVIRLFVFEAFLRASEFFPAREGTRKSFSVADGLSSIHQAHLLVRCELLTPTLSVCLRKIQPIFCRESGKDMVRISELAIPTQGPDIREIESAVLIRVKEL